MPDKYEDKTPEDWQNEARLYEDAKAKLLDACMAFGGRIPQHIQATIGWLELSRQDIEHEIARHSEAKDA